MKVNRLLMSMAVLPFVLYSCSSDKGRITPVPFNEVVLEDGFWKTRMKTELEVTVPFSIEQCRPAVERFRICADYRAGKEINMVVKRILDKIKADYEFQRLLDWHHNKAKK